MKFNKLFVVIAEKGKKIKFLKNKGLLGSLLPFVIVKRSSELRTLTEPGEFKLTGILNDGSRITRSSDWFMSDTFVIGSYTYYLSTQWGGRYNSTKKKLENFPMLWKKIMEWNEKNKTQIFDVRPK